MSVTLGVKWNKGDFQLEFDHVKSLEKTTLRELKSHCERITGADPTTMKLHAFGGLMINDDLPLSTYGIRPGCVVTLKINEKHHKNRNRLAKQNAQQETPKEEKKVSSDEDELLKKLQVIQNKLDQEIIPQIKTYEKDVKEFLNQPSKTDKQKKKQIYTAAYLGEQLMHVLFDLDGFTCGPDNLTARQTRKETVKQAQALLDKVDDIKAAVKDVAVADEE